MSEKLKKICGKYWPPGKEQLLILVLLGLLLAVIAVPAEEKKKETEEMEPAEEPQPAAADSDYESCLEQRLEALLGQVEGVGRSGWRRTRLFPARRAGRRRCMRSEAAVKGLRM